MVTRPDSLWSEHTPLLSSSTRRLWTHDWISVVLLRAHPRTHTQDTYLRCMLQQDIIRTPSTPPDLPQQQQVRWHVHDEPCENRHHSLQRSSAARRQGHEGH